MIMGYYKTYESKYIFIQIFETYDTPLPIFGAKSLTPRETRQLFLLHRTPDTENPVFSSTNFRRPDKLKPMKKASFMGFALSSISPWPIEVKPFPGVLEMWHDQMKYVILHWTAVNSRCDKESIFSTLDIYQFQYVQGLFHEVPFSKQQGLKDM
jgi:hypothetical protein